MNHFVFIQQTTTWIMSNDSNVPPTARGLPHKDSWGSFWLSATRGPKSVWGSFGHMVWVWTERGRRGSLPCHRIGARQRRSDAGAPRVHDAHLQHGPLDPDPYAAAQAFARHPSRCGLQNMCSQPLTGWRQTSPEFPTEFTSTIPGSQFLKNISTKLL